MKILSYFLLLFYGKENNVGAKCFVSQLMLEMGSGQGRKRPTQNRALIVRLEFQLCFALRFHRRFEASIACARRAALRRRFARFTFQVCLFLTRLILRPFSPS